MVDGALEKGLVARTGFEFADKAGVELDIVESKVVELSDLAELAAEMFDAHLAMILVQDLAEAAELIEVLEHAILGNFDPKP
jgi:hypothetical protein